ncbi:hypothetical protein HK101_002243 [Irineochytrium annulatum]|nr:hypothetical protein HK101_002243 [Irineochytrium annulatum]
MLFKAIASAVLLASSTFAATLPPTNNVANFGERCGGFTTSSLPCATGLTCVLASISTPDAGGVCQRVAAIGGACAGNVAQPYVCPTGLTCVRQQGDGYLPVSELQQRDIGGSCLKLAASNENCGGSVVGAPVCKTGLVCKPRKAQKLPVQEVGGVCLSDF